MPSKKQVGYIKILVFALCLIPLGRLIWLGYSDGLGANPVEFVERSTGFWALFILLTTLSLTPIRIMTHRVWQLQLRRMLGLFVFFYACLHITTYFWLDYSFNWPDIMQDIIKHPYVLVGFTAYLLLLPLAITSNNVMIRLLRERWKKLHQLVYLVALLAIVHFWWLVKKDIREPMLYASILIFLMAIRLVYKLKARAISAPK